MSTSRSASPARPLDVSRSTSTPSSADPSHAPVHPLPRQTFHSIEYPGPLTHPTSVLKVIPQYEVDDTFNAPSSEQPWMEMSFRGLGDAPMIGGGRGGGPIRGMRVGSQKVLVKIVKRRRRRVRPADGGGGGEEAMDIDSNGAGIPFGKGKGKEAERGVGEDTGVFTSEIIGAVPQTVRFRAFADWRYTPNPDARIAQLVQSLQDLDYNAILSYQVPTLDETCVEEIVPPPEDPKAPRYRSVIDAQPAPMFTQSKVPQVYNFKNAPQSYVEEVEDEYTGQPKLRYVNKSRFVGINTQRIGHGAALGDVPKVPVKGVMEKMAKANKDVLAKLKHMFEVRPVWTRHGLLAQFTVAENKIIASEKAYLPAVCYAFGAGPFWKCLARLGYDPRQDPSSRFYQRIYFYLSVNRASARNPLGIQADTATPEEGEEREADRTSRSWWEAEQEELIEQGKREPLDRTKAYIFDGREIHRDRPDYQLCDITDPLISRYIHRSDFVVDSCGPQHGWYDAKALDLIKALTKLKYVYVREKGQPAPDSICFSAIEQYERGLRGEEEDEDEGDDDMDE